MAVLFIYIDLMNTWRYFSKGTLFMMRDTASHFVKCESFVLLCVLSLVLLFGLVYSLTE